MVVSGIAEDALLLRTENLNKHFGGVHAVVGFSVDLSPRQIMGLIGPNGSGKTTVFNLISGLLPKDGGRVFFRGQDITQWKTHDITRAGMGRTFQSARLFDGLTVIDNVKAGLCHSADYGFAEAIFRTSRVRHLERQVTKMAEELLATVGLLGLAQERPQNLPYGLQRRLEIARALAVAPQLLLLDEPAAGLNPSEVTDIVKLIGRLRDEMDVAILLIEHHMDVVMPICDEVCVLNRGHTIARGAPQEVQTHPEVLRAYLGD